MRNSIIITGRNWGAFCKDVSRVVLLVIKLQEAKSLLLWNSFQDFGVPNYKPAFHPESPPKLCFRGTSGPWERSLYGILGCHKTGEEGDGGGQEHEGAFCNRDMCILLMFSVPSVHVHFCHLHYQCRCACWSNTAFFFGKLNIIVHVVVSQIFLLPQKFLVMFRSICISLKKNNTKKEFSCHLTLVAFL